jgi:polar amino acid transport system substrate-binding protein
MRISYQFNKNGGANMKNRQTYHTCVVVVAALLSAVLSVQSAAGADRIVPGDSPVLNRIIDNGVIRVGVNPLFKPFSFTNEKKERVGIDIDIANLLASGLGVKLEIVVPNTFMDLFPLAQNGEIDVIIASMSRIFQRSKWVDFTDSYYDTGISVMLSKAKGSQLGISQVKSYEELMDKLKNAGKEDQLIIAATTGKGSIKSIPAFFPKAKVKEYPTNEESAEAVAKGEAHIMVHDEIFLNIWVNDNPDKALYRMTIFRKPYKPDTYGFAVAKKNQSFLNLLNMFIYDQLHAQGYFKQFMGKYIKMQPEGASFDVGESEL